MDFSISEAAKKLRTEVRQFILENPIDSFPCQAEDDMWGFGGWSYEFTRKLGEMGWLTLTWPKEWGGQERSVVEKLAFSEELAYHRAPCAAHLMGDSMANEIIAHGNDQIKEELLPQLAQGVATFWLAFSETEAGSDLLSLQTRADEKGDVFVVNGQKIWSSYANLAHYGYLLARTDPTAPRHKGLSMFIVDKKLPGISIDPIVSLAGHHLHNHVYFDNVKVPASFLLGEKNKGFYQMLKGLEADRFWGRMQKAAICRSVLDELIDYTRDHFRNGVPLCEDVVVRQKLAQMATEIEACRLYFYRIAWMMDQKISVTYEAALGKVFADELGQRLMDVALEILGPYGQLEPDSKWAPFRGNLERWYLVSRGHSIAGGPTEVMKDTIATFGLGLPRK